MTAPKQPSPSDEELHKIAEGPATALSNLTGLPIIPALHGEEVMRQLGADINRALYEAGRESRRVDAAAYALLRSYAHQAYESGKTSLAEYEICLNELEKAYQ